MNQSLVGVGAIIALLVIIVGGAVWMDGSQSRKYEAMTSREMAFLCITHTNLALHIHPELTLLINGEKQAMPANIGITDTCMHTLHTHDDTGKIHIEGPIVREFVLGDFFAVWDMPFSKDQILDHKADATHKITMTVNGEAVETFENTILRDHDEIVISYGTK